MVYKNYKTGLAGAKAVIAGLWTADDTYTTALMKQFGDQALPVYWAGFTLLGDGSTAIFK